MTKAILATKIMSKKLLFSFLANGGMIKFSKYNIAIAIGGDGEEYRELKLVVFSEQEKMPTSVVVNRNNKKKKTVDMSVGEDEDEEI